MKIRNKIQNKYQLRESVKFKFTKCYMNSKICLLSSIDSTIFNEIHKLLYNIYEKLFDEIHYDVYFNSINKEADVNNKR